MRASQRLLPQMCWGLPGFLEGVRKLSPKLPGIYMAGSLELSNGRTEWLWLHLRHALGSAQPQCTVGSRSSLWKCVLG